MPIAAEVPAHCEASALTSGREGRRLSKQFRVKCPSHLRDSRRPGRAASPRRAGVMAPLQLQVPHRLGHQPRVWFEIDGQLVLNPRTREPVNSVVVSEMGTLFADLGSGIGQAMADGRLPARHLVYDFQPIFTIARQRAVTPLDCLLAGTQLVVLDTELWRTAPLTCPYCSAQNPRPGDMDASGKPMPKNITSSWHQNAHSAKGNGQIHTVYLAGKRRVCK